MGKIIASWLLKLHLHVADDVDEPEGGWPDAPTNDQIKDAVIDGIQEEFGGAATVSLIEKTDD